MNSKIMHYTYHILLAFLIASLNCLFAQNIKVPKYSTDEAPYHVSEYATVYGKVYQVHYSKKGHIFINLDGYYPNQKFTGFIFKSNAHNFPNLKYLEGKYVEITGRISMYKYTYEIIIDSPQQIQTKK
ncbi:MAG: hypothetical protein KatS3mg027_2338 [Bacteroidia bacterium]|nr:MAG: hypothetical protein KatS3mg027_2338 [Bacteroidia bacterium]